MAAAHLVIIACWTIFAIVWITAAIFAKRTVERRSGLARHPIYTGALTMLIGSALIVGTRDALALMPLVGAILWVKAWQEEKLLTEHVPDAYPRYRALVKAIVPYVF